MNSVDSSLAAFEIGSLALGYLVLNGIAQISGVRIVEGSVLAAGRFLVLVEGNAEALKATQQEVRRLCEVSRDDVLIDQEMIINPHQDLLPALYSLTQAELSGVLVVVETETVAALLSVAQILARGHGLKIIELKGTRGLQGKGLGFFTGEKKAALPGAEDARTHLRGALRTGRIEVIDQPAPAFREFFALTGNS